MMRIGFLPSDFNPMLLMLGEAEDCKALAGVLRGFARDGQEVAFEDLPFCRVATGSVRLTGEGVPGVQCHDSTLVWRLTPNLAAAFAEQLDDLAAPHRIAGSEALACATEDGIAVKVSRGEYAEDFLKAD